jgi:hypothetical protein
MLVSVYMANIWQLTKTLFDTKVATKAPSNEIKVPVYTADGDLTGLPF